MTHQDAVWIARNGEGAIVETLLRMDGQLQSALEHNKYLTEQLSGWNPEIPNKTPSCICATLPHRHDCPMASDKLSPLSSNKVISGVEH